MENNTYKFGLKGDQRKALVSAMQQLLQAKMNYLGAPTFAYQLADFHIDREGTVTGPENLELFAALAERGFTPEAPEAPAEPVAEAEAPTEPESRTYKAELSDPDCPDRMEVFSAEDDEDAVRQAREFCEGEVVLLELDELDGKYDVVRGVDLAQYPNGLAIEVPRDGFTPEKLDNLCKLVAAKEILIKMALGVDALPIRVLEDRISFPWFPLTEDGDKVLAYSQLITAICRTAVEKTRVTAQPKDAHANPRFTARCWLISIGLVGDEYRLIRKIMTSTLPGNGAWSKGIDPRKAAKAEAPAAIETETAVDDDLPGKEEGRDDEQTE